LKQIGIYVVGAGKGSNEAERELVVEVNGMSVGFLSYTSDEDHIRSVIASETEPGCASYLNSERVMQRVRELKRAVNLVCVSMHWGHEYFSYPSPGQLKVARSLINAGATFVIGHHPHVIQGIEQYNEGLIIYSLGNLFFPEVRTTAGRIQWVNPLAREVIVVKSRAQRDRAVCAQTIGGTVSRDYIVTPFNEEGQQAFVSRVELLSDPIQNEDYGLFWEIYEKKRRRELERENLIGAFKKMVLTPKKDLIQSLSIEDIWRNLRRVRRIIVKGN
jgi:poly-gamma-glutamate synthesis protein (capsule biosynthesis protein)